MCNQDLQEFFKIVYKTKSYMGVYWILVFLRIGGFYVDFEDVWVILVELKNKSKSSGNLVRFMYKFWIV